MSHEKFAEQIERMKNDAQICKKNMWWHVNISANFAQKNNTKELVKRLKSFQ